MHALIFYLPWESWLNSLGGAGLRGLGTALGALVTFLLGSWWGWFDARRRYHKRESLDRINVSLNAFDNGTLQIRTVFERPLDAVFANRYVRDKISSCARKLVKEHKREPPNEEVLIELPAGRDAKFALNFLVNATAECFSRGSFQKEMGTDVSSAWYVLGLACEPSSEDRQQKIHALLVRKEILERFPYYDVMPKTEHDWHKDRARTLRQMAKAYAADPTRFAEMEICV